MMNHARHEAMVERYMQGGCLAFAYALWIAHGSPVSASICVLSNDMGEGWGEIDHEATHLFLDVMGMEIDVEGVRPAATMATSLDLDSWSITAETCPDDAVAIYAGGMMDEVEEGNFPIALDSNDILDALVHIADYPERYGLVEPE